MTMRTSAQPELVAVAPGDRGTISVSVTNTSPVIDAFRVQVFGLDPSWVTVTPDRLSLFPGQTENIDIGVALPEDYPASHRTISVNVSSDDDPGAFSLSEVELEVRPRTTASLRLDPTMITAGRSARFGMIVTNVGNAAVDAIGYAIDPEDLATFGFTPPSVFVAPGRDQVIEVTATGGRNWFGQPRARTFTFGVETDQRVETLGTFIQRPRIGRWMLSLLGLLTAAAVFAFVLSKTFDRVVEEASVSDEVLDAALGANEAGGAVVPTNPGAVIGVLLTSTGTGLSGAQAELFVVDDLEVPVGSAATDAGGAFTFSNLGEGSYKLKLSGSGVNVLWYGDTTNPAEAKTIEVTLSTTSDPTEPTKLDPITIIGVPVDVTGTIDVADPTGVTVSLVVPGAATETAPVVATAELAPDGSFTLTDVPSPGSYRMIVEKPGSAPVARDVELEPGAPLADVKVVVPPASGVITGSVLGPAGPVGGATIIASDGTTSIDTVSLTEGAPGTYELRNLPTPGQYTVTVSSRGYASATRTVTLDGQNTQTFDAQLVPATGSIRGHAFVDGAPSRGVSVTVSGGELNRSAGVLSQGSEAGSYSFVGLDAPGTYTLTFSGEGLVPQVRVVDLDPATSSENATGIDVSLSRERTVVQGVIRNVDGAPVSGATVSLSNGSQNRTVLSADSPLGAFEFSDVAPGAYTLTASLVGTEPVVVLVNVAAATPTAPLDLQLGAQASLTGTVLSAAGGPAAGLPVRLFLPAQFPNGDVLAVTQTDVNGGYTFPSLAAPADYVVAVYAGQSSADPLDSATVRTVPGSPTTVATFTVQLP
jgi:hypothetical protein